MITSCCPGWINLAEQHFPTILNHLSTCKSPQQMFGSVAKSYYAQKEHLDPKQIFVVSIMPCTAKKYEAKRPEMQFDDSHPDVDVVLTTRELGKMLRQMGVEFDGLVEQEFDNPFGITTGAASLFAGTGGVMEAALRTVYEVLNEKPVDPIEFTMVRGMDGIKEASVDLAGMKVKVAIAHTLKNAQVLAKQIEDGTSPYAFIEIMCCPGGCIGGGGQPYGTISKIRLNRLEAVYLVDASMPFRKSHESAAVNLLYLEFLKTPLSPLAHELLHTHYHARTIHH